MESDSCAMESRWEREDDSYSILRVSGDWGCEMDDSCLILRVSDSVSIIHTKVCYTRTTCEPSARLAAAGGGAAAIPAISRSSSGGSHTWVDMAWLRLGGTSESTPVAGTSRGKRSGRAGR